MSLDHAILGFLSYKPLSGYDLKAVFDLSVQHFWPADQSQIYRTLSRLAESGLTEIEVIEQEERPDRKVYHITEQGREELHRWLTDPPPPKEKRMADLVQIFFAGRLTDDEILAIFKQYADRSRQVLDRLHVVPDEAKTRECHEAAEERDAFFWGLTLECGIRMTEAGLAWIEDVIGRLERGEHTKGAAE
jgi:PadR family transcriptional regulator, regulatory protein AphA